MAHIRFLTLSGADISSGSINNLFPDAASGEAVSIVYVQALNNTTGTLTAQRAYLSIDSGGAAVSIAVADSGLARDVGYDYGTSPTPPGSWASPTSYATGLTVPDMATGKKCLLAIRRDPTGAAVAYPERNSLLLTSTGPA